FSSRRRHTRFSRDWSSDVCSSDLDEFLRYLARAGHAIPADCVERDWSLPHRRRDDLVPVFKRIYENADEFWSEYHFCEQLVDVEIGRASCRATAPLSQATTSTTEY